MQLSINFSFLGVHDAKLVELGARAEDYFTYDPPTAIIKLRQFAELLAKLMHSARQVTAPFTKLPATTQMPLLR